jgi:putative transposase
MDIVQIHHTLVDVMVVDREHRLSIGRPWLTLAIDAASRAVVGFSVSLGNPSALSISLLTDALPGRHFRSVLPKEPGWRPSPSGRGLYGSTPATLFRNGLREDRALATDTSSRERRHDAPLAKSLLESAGYLRL